MSCFLVTVPGTSHGYSLNGDDLVMSCDYSGNIEPTSILWYRDGSSNALTATTDIHIVKGSYNNINNLQQSTLTIKSPTSSNNGLHTCAVSVTGANTLNHIVSTLMRATRVLDENGATISQVTVTTSDLVVTCVVKGEEAPAFVNWFKVNADTLEHITVDGEYTIDFYKVSLVLKQT